MKLKKFSSLFLGSSIKCWVCHSDADPKCADPFDNSTLPIKDCSEVQTHLVEGLLNKFIDKVIYSWHLIYLDEGDYERLKQQWDSKLYPVSSRPTPKPKRATMCRKTRQKIFGTWRTIRSCAFEGSPGEGTGNEHHCLIRRGDKIFI